MAGKHADVGVAPGIRHHEEDLDRLSGIDQRSRRQDRVFETLLPVRTLRKVMGKTGIDLETLQKASLIR